MADNQHPDLLAAMLEQYAGPGGSDARPPSLWERHGPLGSAGMAERGPWMRDYLHPQVADMLASLLQYGPMAMGSRAGAGVGRDAVLANRYWNQAMRERPYAGTGDITGGAPHLDPARYGNYAPYAESSAGLTRDLRGLTSRPDSPISMGMPRPGMRPADLPDQMMIFPETIGLQSRPGTRVTAPGANTNKSLRPGEDPYQIPDDPYTMAAIEQSFRRTGKDVPPPALSISELLNRPGMRSAENIGDTFDPVFIGARTGNFYRGPDTPANDHPPGGPYDPSYNRSLMKQRQAEEDAFLHALLDGKTPPPRDPFRP